MLRETIFLEKTFIEQCRSVQCETACSVLADADQQCIQKVSVSESRLAASGFTLHQTITCFDEINTFGLYTFSIRNSIVGDLFVVCQFSSNKSDSKCLCSKDFRVPMS